MELSRRTSDENELTLGVKSDDEESEDEESKYPMVSSPHSSDLVENLKRYRMEVNQQQKKSVKAFYQNQNELIEKIESLFFTSNEEESKQEERDGLTTTATRSGSNVDIDDESYKYRESQQDLNQKWRRMELFVINLSFGSNIALLIIKLIVTLMTGFLILYI